MTTSSKKCFKLNNTHNEGKNEARKGMKDAEQEVENRVALIWYDKQLDCADCAGSGVI